MGLTSNGMVSDAIVMGIDGGGTNTRAVIARGNIVLGRAKGGSIKRLRVGAEAAEANLRALLGDVFAAAGVTRVDAISAGIASASLPAGIGGCSPKNFDPSRPASSDVAARKMADRLGFSGKAAQARAISSSMAHPVALSTAP